MERTLSPDAAAAICRHMNDDHADAVAGYARAYADMPHADAAEIVSLDGHAMQLSVLTGDERVTARIAFDHVLQDTDDARMTLIAMAQHGAARST